jgi:ubiquitin C-terminal hydrolase
MEDGTTIQLNAKTVILEMGTSLYVQLGLFTGSTVIRKLNVYVKFELHLEVRAVDGQIWLYELRAVVYHGGTTESGHFITVGKRKDQWLQINCENVTVWSIQQLFDFGRDNGDGLTRWTPYLFFYSRLEI